MSIIPWESQLVKIIGSTGGTSLKVYGSNEQPVTGRLIAIYGRPGSGKTDLAASLADCKYAVPVLYLNVEGGAWVFAHRSDIQIVDITEWKDFSTILIRLYQAPELPFKTVIVDNVSELQAINVMNIVNQRGTAGINGTGMPTQANWGASTAQMLNSIRLCKNMAEKFGINFIFNVWEDARKDSVTNQIVKSGIGFTPALARSFPGIVDIVGHLTVKDDPPNYTRILNFAANPHSDAKFRRNRQEVGQQIPLTIAYRTQQPLVDVMNTLIGGEKWPSEKYKNLEGQARVDYATNTAIAEGGQQQSVVEAIVANKIDAGEA
jgi:hypothetical protein